MAIIVGDIHGNVERVKAFLDYKPEEEHIALGDYVDSFYEPPGRQLLALQLLLDSKAVLLWGNHDLHYLKTPPFVCTGYQHNSEQALRKIIEANKYRFKAAYTVDGWLCTHAGVHIRLAKRETESVIADRLNRKMTEYLDKPSEPGPQGIFAIGGGRGGESRNGGIFWLDFKREDGLDLSIRQIFGHTETPEPVVTETYVALDTTNNKNNCWIYDTTLNELVAVPMARRIALIADLPKEEQGPFFEYLLGQTVPGIGAFNEEDYMRWKRSPDYDTWLESPDSGKPTNYPQRLRDLPQEEQEPFNKYLVGKGVPHVHGIPDEEQDFYWPADYRQWKKNPNFWSPM